VPIVKASTVVAVLDIDSAVKNDFSQTDQQYLEELALILSELF
jgi:putative methionine-R-sulfoxide reductase with GAF domain